MAKERSDCGHLVHSLMRPHRKSSRGFGLIMAIFILITLASLMAYLVPLIGMMSNTSTLALMSAQTEVVAKTGLEWGLHQVKTGAIGCNDTPITVTLPAVYFGYSLTVTVPCTFDATGAGSAQYTEGVDPDPVVVYDKYTIISIAKHGTFGDKDYVTREIRQTIVLQE